MLNCIKLQRKKNNKANRLTLKNHLTTMSKQLLPVAGALWEP